MSTRLILLQLLKDLVSTHAVGQQFLNHSLGFRLFRFFRSFLIRFGFLCFELGYFFVPYDIQS